MMSTIKNATGLPKWPQMLVTGVPVTEEQAREIIRRTDYFFYYSYGNDKKYCNRVCQVLGVPQSPEWDPDHSKEQQRQQWRKYCDEQQAFRERWRVIHTNYVHNHWISSSFIHGPYGWCHPSGKIGFVDNVGKWPSVDDVMEDWRILAREFPFLDLGVSLMDRESCEDTGESPAQTLASMRVRGGTVELVEPGPYVHAGHPPATRADQPFVFDPYSFGKTAIPWSWVEDWARTHGP